MSQFSEQGFVHDLAQLDWEKISLIPDIECAWNYFYEGLINIINKHAPFKKYCVKGRDNPWFSPTLSNSLHEHDVAWARARHSDLQSDWLCFRRLRNRCTMMTRKAKADYF